MPGYTHNIAIGVSAGGLIAGTAATATGDLRAFVFSDGQFITADLPTGFFGSSGSNPNSRGQITGQLVNDDNSRVIAFVQDGNTVDVLRLPNGFRSSVGHAINSSGQVVGVAATESWQRVEAFVYSAGTTRLLGTLPGNTDSDAVSINSAGQIVGNSSGGSGPTQAFLYANGAMSALGTFGPYVDTLAQAINDAGQVAGFAYTADYFAGPHAYLYNPVGGFTALEPLPGFTNSAAYALNASGAVVGTMSTAANTSAAFLYSSGQVKNLNDLLVDAPGWVVTEASSIADNGLIAARATFDGVSYSVLLTPVPEPATNALCAAAAGFGVALWRRRRLTLSR